MVALSLATDVGLGAPLGSGLRICLLSMRLAEAMNLLADQRRRVYYLALLRHIGCTVRSEDMANLLGDEIEASPRFAPLDMADPRQFLPAAVRMLREQFPGARLPPALVRMMVNARAMNRGAVAMCEVAQMLADRMGFDDVVQSDIISFPERWDGKGMPGRRKGDDLSPAVRVVQLAEGLALLLHVGDERSALDAVRARRGIMYAPDAVDAFLRRPRDVLSAMEIGSMWDVVTQAAPADDGPLDDDRLDASLRAMADFADLKSRYLVGHSSGVARLASGAVREAGMPEADALAVYRAGLVHDLGRVGVSTAVWAKPGPLSLDEWEKVRMHSYYTDRILSRPEMLHRIGTLASTHHERLDASGYFRSLPANQQPPAARVLAAADAFHAMTEPRPHRPAMSPSEAARGLRGEVEAGRLDADASEAVVAAAGERGRRRRPQVAGLTAREVEVLRLAARGASIREIARTLVIAPKTADAHLQHIYSKAGVSTRAAATLFAMQHDLLEPPSA